MPALPCPAPCACAQDSKVGPQLLRLIRTRFKDDGTLQQALALVNEGGGIARWAGIVLGARPCPWGGMAAWRGCTASSVIVGIRVEGSHAGAAARG